MNVDMGTMMANRGKNAPPNGTGHFYKSSTRNVDERFGFREAGSILHPVEPTPYFNLYVMFSPNGSTETFHVEFQKPIETVSRVWLRGVDISNIVGTHEILALNFEGTLDPGHNTVVAGFPNANSNIYILPCGGVADLNYQPSDQHLLCVYRQLKKIPSLSLRITNPITGAPVAYEKCILSFGLETESFLL
jgi:hypothetical protein